MLKYIPDEINVEDILSYLPKETYLISIDGLHKRNSYKDIISCEDIDGKQKFHIGRKSLYNSLPEYMFHPINRFDNIPERDREERFAKECANLEKEKEAAHQFFSPIDALLLDLKVRVKEQINQYTCENVIMQKIIGDTLTEEEKSNRFIKRTIPFLPICKRIRGNRTLVTLLLRKVLFEEGVTFQKEEKSCEITDNQPQYNYQIEEHELDSLYLGNRFSENITTYNIHYWSEAECNMHFSKFLEDLEQYRCFIKDYFLSIEDELCFRVNNDNDPLILSDDSTFNYLNFNTNL